MSTNCVQCVTNKRTGGDLLCDGCRTARVVINSLRVQFATHAPVKVPKWFTGTALPSPAEIHYDFAALPAHQRDLLGAWIHDLDNGDDDQTLVETIERAMVDLQNEIDASAGLAGVEAATELAAYTPEFLAWAAFTEKRLFAHRAAKAQHRVDVQAARYFEWRWYYADLMIACQNQPYEPTQPVSSPRPSDRPVDDAKRT